MKILVRTIVLGAVMFFSTLFVLHCTIVETVKQEMDAASVNALYRTIDAYEANQELIAEGDTSNLYFSTDQDYYYYYYDSFMVQLNGKLKITINCNEVNVENGDLDMDITATYKGVGTKDRTYTVHVDTYDKIITTINYTEDQKVLAQKLANAPVGKKIKWAEHNWVLVADNNDITTLLLDEDLGTTQYGLTEKYSGSNLEAVLMDFENNDLKQTDLECLQNTSLNNLNTYNGNYTENGIDLVSGKVFALSTEEALILSRTGYEGNFWLRTASGLNEVYIYENGVSEINNFSKKNVSENILYRPAVNILKSKLSNLTEDGEYYVLNVEDTEIDWELNAVNNVGWSDDNGDILTILNSLEEGTYKLSAVVTLTDITNANTGDMYGVRINENETLFSYDQIIINNPYYFETEFTIDEVGMFNSLKLFGCGNSISGKTGTASFSNIKITKIN